MALLLKTSKWNKDLISLPGWVYTTVNLKTNSKGCFQSIERLQKELQVKVFTEKHSKHQKLWQRCQM